MAAVLVYCTEDREKFELQFTTTADSDTTQAIALTNGFLAGGGYAARSGANAFTTTVEYSIDGTNWVTLGSMSEGAPNVDFTAAKVAAARFVRGKTTTNGAAQTLTVSCKLAR